MNKNTEILKVELSLPVMIREGVFDRLHVLDYVDPAKVFSGSIELGTVEFEGNVFLVRANVDKGVVTSIRLSSLGIPMICACQDPMWGPIARAALKHFGVDLEHLDPTPLPFKDLLEGICGRTKVYCSIRIAVTVIEVDHKKFAIICIWVCGRVADCGQVELSK